MRRVVRHLFTMFVALSLLLCVALCVLWVRSYWISDLLSWKEPRWSAFVITADGEFWFGLNTGVDDRWIPDEGGFQHRTDEVDGGGVFPDRIPGDTLHFHAYGFAVVTGVRWGENWNNVFLPGWFIFSITVAVPVVWFGRIRQRRRRPGHCGCGYDLRASPERCPECGTAVTRGA
jgi:hypothetical protein